MEPIGQPKLKKCKAINIPALIITIHFISKTQGGSEIFFMEK